MPDRLNFLPGEALIALNIYQSWHHLHDWPKLLQRCNFFFETKPPISDNQNDPHTYMSLLVVIPTQPAIPAPLDNLEWVLDFWEPSLAQFGALPSATSRPICPAAPATPKHLVWQCLAVSVKLTIW